MLDYGPQTAADNKHQTVNPLDISAMKMITEAKSFTPIYQHQLSRPSLTNPYLVTETAEKILLQIIAANQQYDPMAKLTEHDLITRAVNRAMKLAKALHDEFKKYEEEIELEATVKASEELQKEVAHAKRLSEEQIKWNRDNPDLVRVVN